MCNANGRCRRRTGFPAAHDREYTSADAILPGDCRSQNEKNTTLRKGYNNLSGCRTNQLLFITHGGGRGKRLTGTEYNIRAFTKPLSNPVTGNEYFFFFFFLRDSRDANRDDVGAITRFPVLWTLLFFPVFSHPYKYTECV